MTTVTLYEAPDGSLYLHLEGEPTLWRMNLRTASTFLTDGMLLANRDTASHPDIFSTAAPWPTSKANPVAEPSENDAPLYPIAILQLDPDMGVAAAAYTLFRAE